MSDPVRSKVRAVVVTFNPDLSRLTRVVESLAPQVEGIVIVDNGSKNSEDVRAVAQKTSGVDFLSLPDNMGIGTALNVGSRHFLLSKPDWILTMDQDTVVHVGGVDAILASFTSLRTELQDRVAILAMRPHPQPSSIWLTRYADRLLMVRDLGSFVERIGVITSGNLVRADVLERLCFNESLFIDQVDFDFCFSVRHLGYYVLQHKSISMDHVLGERFSESDKEHPYENAQRVYYIIRNSTYLVMRRRLPLRFYLVQVVVFSGAFVSMNGAGSVFHCALVVLRGMLDGALGRLGRREYSFLTKGRR
jgi:rhamnosyltransferase